MDKQDVKSLTKRYLIWLYKTTKEAFDCYERKFTQLEIDEYLLNEIEKELKGAYLPDEKKAMEKVVNDFRAYISEKEKACLKLKYKGKKTNPEFLFLDIKLKAVEKAIVKELGQKMLVDIKEWYEEEMIDRIYRSTSEK